MKVTRKDVFTPANATSILGLSLTIFGSLNLTTLHGVLLLGLGRFVDIFDGKIARATHTSRFGATLDATCDKIGLAILIPATWIAQIAPYWLLVYIFVQNVLNVIISWLITRRGGSIVSSKMGKYAMFMQNISLGSYALSSVTEFSAFSFIGLILGITSIYWAAQATYGYAQRIPAKRPDTSQ